MNQSIGFMVPYLKAKGWIDRVIILFGFEL